MFLFALQASAYKVEFCILLVDLVKKTDEIPRHLLSNLVAYYDQMWKSRVLSHFPYLSANHHPQQATRSKSAAQKCPKIVKGRTQIRKPATDNTFRL